MSTRHDFAWPRRIRHREDGKIHAGNLREVRSGLYVGSLVDAALAGPWTARVDLTYGDDAKPYAGGPDQGPYLHVSQLDGAPIEPADLERIEAFVREALARPEPRVLVHCFAGQSRSVSVVWALLKRLDKLSSSECSRRAFSDSGDPNRETWRSAANWARCRNTAERSER